VEPRDRITVVEQVYHRPADGGEPTVAETRFSRELASQEQPFERRAKVGEDWQPLEHGWLESAGMLLISNEEGRHLQVNPTDEERLSISRRVLELIYAMEDDELLVPQSSCTWLIPPGESMRAYPSDVSRLCVRCQSGVARFTLRLYPR
jgi:hypothetical protein